MNEFLLQRIKTVPEKPGVYIFKDKNGHVLYVGKAKNLKNRLRSYLQPQENPRLRVMVSKIRDLQLILTGSESEALLLEANLIKQYKPYYNIRLKDDKKYPYLKITIKDYYPGIFATRDLSDRDSIYFGPYTSAKALRKTIRMVRNLFPVRTCTYKLAPGKRFPACIDYHIGKCIGPCVVDVPREEYMKLVNGIIELLSGRTTRVEKILEEEMKEAAENLEFERAAKIRDNLLALRELLSPQSVVSPNGKDLEVWGYALSRNFGVFVVLNVKTGKLVYKETFFVDTEPGISEIEAFEKFLWQYYSTATLWTNLIIVPELPPSVDYLRAYLEKKTEKKIKIRKPVSDENSLLKLAMENAQKELEIEIQKLKIEDRAIHPSLFELKDLLKLDRVPERIEAVDISHTFGNNPVGSIVVFEKGYPKKSDYRKYRIKTVQGIDDFSMIHEVVKRRLRRLTKEGKRLPDIFVIDGGVGQLNQALAAARELGVQDVYFLAIAKRFDELYTQDGKVLMLPRRSEALKLIQRLRNEAHRFAITFHRDLRTKEGFVSFLDTIPDIGEKRKQALISYFGSLSRLMSASVEEIQRVEGIGPKLAQKIYYHLHGD